MIRVIAQRRVPSAHSFLQRVRMLHDTFNISYFKAIKLDYKLNKGYGIVINTIMASKDQGMMLMMSDIHSKLHRFYDTQWKIGIEGCGQQIPLKDYKQIIIKGGYRVFISLKPGFIDSRLEIY